MSATEYLTRAGWRDQPTHQKLPSRAKRADRPWSNGREDYLAWCAEHAPHWLPGGEEVAR